MLQIGGHCSIFRPERCSPCLHTDSGGAVLGGTAPSPSISAMFEQTSRGQQNAANPEGLTA